MSVDFPRAWQISKDTPIIKHDKGCSYRIAKGGFLCDCDVLYKHPDYVDDVMQCEVTIYECMACGQKFPAGSSRKTYVRHQKYGGCTWGVGRKLK